MYTILQDSNNNLQLPFKGDYLYLLIVFTYRNKSVIAIFQNNSGINCDYEINIIEVGSDGIADVNNGQIKLSPRGTWKAKIYGQQDNINLAPENATLLYEYDFQVKGESCKVYPTDVKGCPDARIIVENQDGDILVDETLASGETEIIVIKTSGIDVLYAYNYAGFNTGQNVSYGIGDDKWVRDNIFNPEIASWPTDRRKVYPELDSNNPLLLSSGATPEGTNIFGNLNRFTDTVGTQVYANDLVIDHYTGLMNRRNVVNISTFQAGLNAINILTVDGFNNFFLPNTKIVFENIIAVINSTTYPFLIGETLIRTSTTEPDDNTFTNAGVKGKISGRISKAANAGNYAFRKAFTYDPLQDTTKLILS